MATIQSSIQLMDKMSGPLNAIVGSINMTISALRNVNNTAVNIDTTALSGAQDAINTAGARIRELEAEIRDNTNAQDNFNSSLHRSATGADNLFNKLKRMAAVYLGIQSLKMGINLSDTMTQNTARLNLMNDGKQTTEELQSIIYQSAQNSRGNYLNTTDSIAKMGLMAPDAFNSNTELVGFMELINKQFKIAGTNAAGIDAAMLQLTQAMGAGALRGEELNSVLEQAPIIVRNIASYMKVPVGHIKDLASQGKITATVVKNAMFAASTEINRQFESIPLTFTDITTQIKNIAVKNFEPVGTQINTILNSERAKEFIDNVTLTIGKLITTVSSGIEIIAAVGAVVYDNWDIIAPVLGTVVGMMAAYNLSLQIAALRTAVVSGATLAYNLALIAYSVLTGTANTALITTTASQWRLNAALLACPIFWIPTAIALVIGGLYAAVAVFNKFTGSAVSATGIITGAFATVGAVVWNVFGSLINIVVSFAEFFVNVFTNPIESVKRLFLNLGLNIINIFRSITSIIDKIAKTDFSERLNSVAKNLDAKLSVEVEGYRNLRAETGGGVKYIDTGSFAAEWYGKGDKLSNTFNLSGVMDKTNNLLEMIKDNTATTNDSLDLTTEEIKYMRDLAEMEVVNRFTTAEIKVEVQNNNNISSNIDLDDIVDSFESKIREKMQMAAEGVYD